MIKVYTGIELGQQWLDRYRGKKPLFTCVLGFTATGLIPGISAAGATPDQRRYTAIADAEFLINGALASPSYPLPPLTVGASPVLITRGVVHNLDIPVYLFNAGLPTPPVVSTVDLGGIPAGCVSSGKALPLETVEHLFKMGLIWGERLAQETDYLIISECVVGGTTTALALLTGLGINAQNKINSSHRQCNHQQKWSIVQTGLNRANLDKDADPLLIVAAVGDPMQIVVAGMAISASHHCGVLLGGGTQMLAVYALINALNRGAKLESIAIGTTRWVMEDSTGDTIGLVKTIEKHYQLDGLPMMATQLSFANSEYETLRAYEQGYVKEGVGAGAAAIAAHLYGGWSQVQLQQAIDSLARDLARIDV